MVGKNHLRVSVPTLVAGGTAVFALSRCDGTLGEIGLRVLRAFVPAGGVVKTVLWVLAGLALYALGTLLPDIDSRGSTLGRFIYLPVRHRTLTHTIWVVLLLGLLSWKLPLFWWLTFGYFAHIFWDSLSVGGIAWTWPIGRYIYYPNGASVKKGFRIKLYHTGEASETAVLIGASALMILFSAGFLLQAFGIWK